MKKKTYIIIIVVVLIYGFLMFFFNKKEDKKNISKSEKNVKITDKYLISGNNNFYYSKGKFFTLSRNYVENSKYPFYTYSDNNELGLTKLKYGTVWNIFDINDNYINYDGYLFAYSNNFKIKKINFDKRELNNDDKDFLTSNLSLTNFSSLAINEVVEYDLNNDSINEEIICVTNIADDSLDSMYSVVILKLNNNNYTIKLEKEKNMKNQFTIRSLFTLNNEYYLVIDGLYDYDENGNKYHTYIYKFNNNRFINVTK